MSYDALISFISAVYSAALAWYVWSRDRGSFVHRSFAAGMLILSLEAAAACFGTLADTPGGILRWERWRFAASSLVPGLWLLFSMSYGRFDYNTFLVKWTWILVPAFVLPPIAVLFQEAFFKGAIQKNPSGAWLLQIGWSGYAFQLFFIAAAVLILMNLERALRRSTGHIRWQMKFMVLGLGSLFGLRIYTSSQALLYHTVNTGMNVLDSAGLIMAGLFIIRSLLRNRLLDAKLYLSQSFLYNSFAVLLVGFYFIVVGVLAKIALHYDVGNSLSVRAFIIFLIFLGLPVLLLSDRLRRRLKRFVSHHLQRPFYDYRKEWSAFTRCTSSLTEMKDLCGEVAQLVSRTFDTLSVTIWLWDEPGQVVTLGGSTFFSSAPQGVKPPEDDVVKLIRGIRRDRIAADFDYNLDVIRKDGPWPGMEFFRSARIRYAVPLAAGEKFIGLMTLGDRISGDPFTFEDFELLKTIADQSACSLLNLDLSRHLREAKEMEAFQAMSAFFIHDLKNLASRLSLTMQNLPVHFESADFRRDALRTISQSLSRIESICRRLSSLRKLELKPAKADLNEVVQATLSGMNGSLQASLSFEPHPLPELIMDREQIHAVLVNLVVNADEAAGQGGAIVITTGQRGPLAELSVTDNGCGMTKEFMENGLFRPFRTTKKQGMGIGLFQSKVIIEAHGGRIEVESEEKQGSTFRVLLPLAGQNESHEEQDAS